MDDMAENNIHVILSTPSGARPAWMSEKYPEVLRVNGIELKIFMDKDIIIVLLHLYIEKRLMKLIKF